MSVFDLLPKPLNGVNWEPTPSDYTSLPAPTKYGDTDFANEDFVSLWGIDSSTGVGRNDLQTIKNMGFNTVKMYNWSVPAPNGYWMRNHLPFLAKAQELGLSVILPISNYFTGMAFNIRTNNSNSGGPSSEGTDAATLQQWITWILTEIYSSGNAPGPAIMWAIGNEYDNSNLGAYGYCEAQDIATIAQYIVNAEESLGIASANVLAFTSPVTTALTPVNQSIPCSVPYNTLMGGCAIEALLAAFGALSERFIASVNSYQTGAQLTTYYNTFPTILPASLSFFYGELGWSEALGGTAQQAQNVYNQFTTTLPEAGPTSGPTAYYYGACLFEFSDELWKGPTGSSETTFGVYTFPAAGPTTFANEGDHSPVWGATYPVDFFVARTAAGCVQSALTGSPASGCTGPSSPIADMPLE